MLSRQSPLELVRRYGATNRLIYEHISKQVVPVEHFGEILELKKNLFFDTLLIYKPPNAESKKLLSTGKVTVDGEEKKLESKDITFATELSKILVL